MRRSAWRIALAAVAGAAALAAGTSFPAPPRADAAASATPTPTPTPTPSPPPHGYSCTDGTNGPGWIDGVFAIPDPNNPNVSGNTALAIYPNSSDAQTYFAQYIAQLQQRQALAQAAQQAKGAVPTVLPQSSTSSSNANSISMLLQRLQPTQRGTSVDSAGNWACHGLTSGTYLILATSTSNLTVTDPNATPVPLPASNLYAPGFLNQVQQRVGRHTTITTYYYTLTINVQYNSSNRSWETKVPFSAWQLVATIVQG